MLEASHCKSTYSNRSISSGESTDVEDEEEHYAKEIKIPKSGNERYLEAEIPKSDEFRETAFEIFGRNVGSRFTT